jgi:hypothetical protein
VRSDYITEDLCRYYHYMLNTRGLSTGRIGLLLRSNKTVLYSTSLAKPVLSEAEGKAAAFFNISRSMRSCPFSLRGRNNSVWLVKFKAAVLVVDGVVGLGSVLVQRPIAPNEIPKLSAACWWVWPFSLTNFAASCLNSKVNWGSVVLFDCSCSPLMTL